MVAADSKSGATFERVVIDGEPYVVKHVALEQDWIAHAMGDVGSFTLLVWSSGLLNSFRTASTTPTPARRVRGGTPRC